MMIPLINPEAEAVAKRLWDLAVKDGRIPPEIPPNPDIVYAKDWQGWCDWMGLDPTIDPRDLDRIKAGLPQ